jgi:tRNA modification GTPase
MNVLKDTIIAISTPIGYGALGIVRLSGPRSLPIAQKLFKQKKIKEIRGNPRRLILGNLFDFRHGQSFDEAYLAFFPKPNSYTREDMVEISCHGSPVILEEVVRLGIKAGARHAHPGEFTLRAFVNGRLDIIQAEAVNDIITAASLEQAKISFRQLDGRLSRKIGSLRLQLVHLLSEIEASIEFPDESLPITVKKVSRDLAAVISAVKNMVESYSIGKSMREGLTLAIVGKTNVGKSTLFNAILERERAIVTPYPGTTRDYLEERVKIKNSLFRLVDMAGLSRPSHPVEEMGIKKGKKLAAQADGILLVFDSSKLESPEDLALVKKFGSKKTILVFNKTDLPARIDKKRIRMQAKEASSVEVSALTGKNLEQLKKEIHEVFVPSPINGEEVILHFRQKLILEKIAGQLERGLELLQSGYPEDVYVEEIRQASLFIGRLTGEIMAEDVISDIFSRFCVGK